MSIPPAPWSADLEPLTRFSATVEDYRRYRPDYPETMIEWVVSTRSAETEPVVLDLACGTGIVTGALIDRGLRVVGIDPNADMLACARRAHPSARFVRSRAERTGLRDESVDLVLCGQAFHWFEVPQAIREVDRVLRPGGMCSAFWNDRVADDFGRAYDKLLRKHCPEYVSLVEAGWDVQDYVDALEGHTVRNIDFEHSQKMNLEAFLGRVRSSSYVRRGVSDMAAFEAELRALHALHQVGGEVTFQYCTVTLLWERG